jgi:hypothetical protein
VLALPIARQIAVATIAPPILACLWWLKSRGWANTVQSGDVSQETKERQKTEFWLVLGALYLIAFGTMFYNNVLSSSPAPRKP